MSFAQTAATPSNLRWWLASGTRPPIFSFVVCFLLLLAALFGEWLTPYAKNAADFTASLAPPFWQEGGTLAHPLGADQTGRDVLARLIASARVSLLIALTAISIGGGFGVLVGVIAGYAGGAIDAIIMRVVDAFLAIPFILMALAVVSAVGSGLGNIVIVMIVTDWPRYARLVRSEVVSIKGKDFVTLARIGGVSPARIMQRHILPNAIVSAAALAVLDLGRVIILESSLSFLGVGIQPPNVSWGLMLADGRMFMGFAWWLTTMPGIAIALAVYSFNSLGEWLKGRLDPRGKI